MQRVAGLQQIFLAVDLVEHLALDQVEEVLAFVAGQFGGVALGHMGDAAIERGARKAAFDQLVDALLGLDIVAGAFAGMRHHGMPVLRRLRQEGVDAGAKRVGDVVKRD
ncbi:hypothetical protein D9M70_587320 [compost metagenome]